MQPPPLFSVEPKKPVIPVAFQPENKFVPPPTHNQYAPPPLAPPTQQNFIANTNTPFQTPPTSIAPTFTSSQTPYPLQTSTPVVENKPQGTTFFNYNQNNNNNFPPTSAPPTVPPPQTFTPPNMHSVAQPPLVPSTPNPQSFVPTFFNNNATPHQPVQTPSYQPVTPNQQFQRNTPIHNPPPLTAPVSQPPPLAANPSQPPVQTFLSNPAVQSFIPNPQVTQPFQYPSPSSQNPLMQPPPLVPPSNNQQSLAQPPPLFPGQQQGNQLNTALPNAPPLMPPPLSIYPSNDQNQNAAGDDKRTDKTPTPVDILPGPLDKFVVYETNSPNPPPPSLNNFITVDKGNCGPRYIRSSIYTVPATPDLAKKSCIPFGCVLQPLADPRFGESPVPIIDFGESGPVRCARCGAYVNSHDTFIDGGRKYVCFLCTQVNTVPEGYITPLQPFRPELKFGSVEFCAPGEYIRRDPVPITIIFILDVSLQSDQIGLIKAFAQSVRSILRSFPPENNYQIGFITFDETVHFYNFNSTKSPKMLVVPDLEDSFLPLPPMGTLITNYNSSKEIIDNFLITLPKMFESTTSTKCAFGAASRLAGMMLKETGGRLVTFLSSLPSFGPGIIENRLKVEHIGTEREREYFKPQNDYYEQMAKDFNRYKIGADLFLFANTFMDIATIAPLSNHTGGQIYYYPRFNLKRDMLKFHHELNRNITRTSGFDGIMKIRTSAGLEISDYYGNLNRINGSDLEVASINCDKTFAVKIQIESKLVEDSKVGIQCALLYTTSSGERRIRVHTLALTASSVLSKVFSSADQEAVMYILASQALEDVKTQSLAVVRKQLFEKVINGVHAFRSFCSTKAFNPSILVLPEGLKLHPVFTVALLKSILLKTGKARFFSLSLITL